MDMPKDMSPNDDDDSHHDEKPQQAQSQQHLLASTETLESFHDDVQYLWMSHDIPVYEEPPSAMDFLRNHVAVSRPCIIRNAILNESAQQLLLTLDDLVEQFPDLKLQVDVTPDGHGDCLRRVNNSTVDADARNSEAKPTSTNNDPSIHEVFVKPMEIEMSISNFCRNLRAGRVKQQKASLEQRLHAVSSTDFKDRIFSCPPNLLDAGLNDKNGGEQMSDPSVSLDDCVLYYSRQNDCLRQELAPLWNLMSSTETSNASFVFPRSFEWAEQAFFGNNRPSDVDRGPDAVNLWMGDERAVSAMHKDHYENLFYVLSGEKVFSLCPPADAPFLFERKVISGRFQAQNNKVGVVVVDDDNVSASWSVVLDRESTNTADNDNATESKSSYSTVHWIAADPFRNDTEHNEFSLLQYAHPIPDVRVRKGELLYLPSLWFHRVTQTRETVGINYWYDMNFASPLWCYFHLLQQMQSTKKGDDCRAAVMPVSTESER